MWKLRRHVSSAISCQKVYQILICEKEQLLYQLALITNLIYQKSTGDSKLGKTFPFCPTQWLSMHSSMFYYQWLKNQAGSPQSHRLEQMGHEGHPHPRRYALEICFFTPLEYPGDGWRSASLKWRFPSRGNSYGEGIFHQWHHLNFAMWEARVSFKICPIKCFIRAGCASILSCIPPEPQPLLLTSPPTLVGRPGQWV